MRELGVLYYFIHVRAIRNCHSRLKEVDMKSHDVISFSETFLKHEIVLKLEDVEVHFYCELPVIFCLGITFFFYIICM